MQHRSALKWVALKLIITGLKLAFFTGLIFTNACAYDPKLESEALKPKPIKPDVVFKRTQAVLRAFGVPPETDPQTEIDLLAGQQTAAGFATLADTLNPDQAWRRFVKKTPDVKNPVKTKGKKSPKLLPSNAAIFAQDADSRQVTDFEMKWASKSEDRVPTLLSHKLRGAALATQQKRDLPLSGIRIALDPGHMGGDAWDEASVTKFVRDASGRKVSEGVLTLQTALLLEKQLIDLGATVMLTRRTIGPVSTLSPDDLDLTGRALHTLRNSTQAGWFQELLRSLPAKSKSDLDLVKVFQKSERYQALYAQEKKLEYFILGEDLDARVEAINNFGADLVLIIHYDTAPSSEGVNGVNRSGYNRTKAYVAGAYQRHDLSSRQDRADFAKHAMDPVAYRASIQLSRALVGEISSKLGIDFDEQSPGYSIPVEQGVYQRSLVLNQRITGTALCYLETLYYNDKDEFERLINTPLSMEIGGVAVPYSPRTQEIADALRAGVLRFFKNYRP